MSTAYSAVVDGWDRKIHHGVLMHHRVLWHFGGVDCAASNRRLRGGKPNGEVVHVLDKASEFSRECAGHAWQIDSVDPHGLRRSASLSSVLVIGPAPPTRMGDSTDGNRLCLQIDRADCQKTTRSADRARGWIRQRAAETLTSSMDQRRN
jgi:hypothetical protein